MKLSCKIRMAIIRRNRQRLLLLQKRKNLRKEEIYFDLPEKRFQELFRFPKDLARKLIAEIAVHMSTRTRRDGLTASIRVLTALRFFATGKINGVNNLDNKPNFH